MPCYKYNTIACIGTGFRSKKETILVVVTTARVSYHRIDLQTVPYLNKMGLMTMMLRRKSHHDIAVHKWPRWSVINIILRKHHLYHIHTVNLQVVPHFIS